MGPFLQSVNPKFHEYKAKWDSGELSCVSVFHKYVVHSHSELMFFFWDWTLISTC